MVNGTRFTVRWVPLLVLGFFPWGLGANGLVEDLGRNKRTLERIKRDSDRYQRLSQNYSAWQLLSSQEKESLRTLDREIHSLDPARESRLLEVGRRYSDWVESLPETTRAEIKSLPAGQAQIEKIQKILLAQWEERLPKVDRDMLASLEGAKKSAAIVQLKSEERTRHQANEFKKKRIIQIADLSGPSKAFVEQLKTQLSNQELEKLNKLDQKKGLVFKTIMDLAESHPLLPKKVDRPDPPLTIDALPLEIRSDLKKMRQMEKSRNSDVQRAEGKWPAFCLVVTRLMRTTQPEFNQEYGASRLEEFPPEARTVMENSLFPLLSPEEIGALEIAQGKWPDYPLLVRKLANDHLTFVPGLSIPAEIQGLKQPKPILMR